MSDRSQPSVRTDEERERDRAERERRRAASQPVSEAVEAPLPPPAVAPPAVPPTASETQEIPPPAIPAQTVAPAPPQAQPPPPLRRGRSWPVRVLAVLALLLVAGAVWLAVDRLTTHTTAPKPLAAPVVVRVLIPEGETRRQIAARAHAAGLTGSYLTASKRSSLLNPAHYGAPASTPDLEGFLFPATYDLYRGDPAGRLVHEQLLAFTERFGDAEIRRARELHVTPYQLLIVASMIEREAQLPGDRAKVAAVVYNRLRLNMALGIDATLRYALNDYTKPLTAAQLALDSPYNTRRRRGLPPTPISNPGLAAIAAAAHPAHAGYLYYVAAADGCGGLVFSNGEAQFEHDAAAYREALASGGGRVPTCRKR
ncbi:MAG TPA: endolytic transglycosylase MltG [Solirubrobacteraceae bacterium]|nr:endolytic transglycosylase MltG [Solirubrobacteraceae bacterium]